MAQITRSGLQVLYAHMRDAIETQGLSAVIGIDDMSEIDSQSDGLWTRFHEDQQKRYALIQVTSEEIQRYNKIITEKLNSILQKPENPCSAVILRQPGSYSVPVHYTYYRPSVYYGNSTQEPTSVVEPSSVTEQALERAMTALQAVADCTGTAMTMEKIARRAIEDIREFLSEDDDDFCEIDEYE